MMAAFLPPTLFSFSKRVTLKPLFANNIAAVSPPGPAPTILIFFILDNILKNFVFGLFLRVTGVVNAVTMGMAIIIYYKKNVFSIIADLIKL